MSDYPGEIVTIRVVDPVDEHGLPLDDQNASATISILTGDQTTTLIANQAMPWDPVAGKFSYGWVTSTGDDPGEYLAKLTVTPTGGIGGVEWKVLELLPLPILSTTCGGPWVSPDSVAALKDLETSDQDLIVEAASGMLFAASGRQFTGVCEDTVWPDPTSGFLYSRLTDGSWFRSPYRPGDVSGGLGFAGVGSWRELELPGFPIVDVVEVKVAGVPLPVGSWNILDDRYIIRRDGVAWPSTQLVDRADGSEGTWSVRYRWGNPIPPGGTLAGLVLVSELAKCPVFLDDSSCRLPRRLQTVNREGFSAVVLDPFKFLDEGKFGVYEIDTFINTVNPHRLSRDGKVLNVDLMASAPRRVR